jgi:hypothetical protein
MFDSRGRHVQTNPADGRNTTGRHLINKQIERIERLPQTADGRRREKENQENV